MGRVYAGVSAEDRGDARRRRFLDAAIELAGTRGLANTSVRGICEEAALSTRFFYEHFDSLDALLLAAYDECVESALTTILGAIAAAGPDRDDRARAAMTAIVDYLDTEPNRARLLYVEALGSRTLAERRRETMRLQERAIAAIAESTYAVDDDPLVHVTSTLVAGGVAELMIGRLDGSIRVPREQLIDHCARLLVAIGDTATALARRA